MASHYCAVSLAAQHLTRDCSWQSYGTCSQTERGHSTRHLNFALGTAERDQDGNAYVTTHTCTCTGQVTILATTSAGKTPRNIMTVKLHKVPLNELALYFTFQYYSQRFNIWRGSPSGILKIVVEERTY